LRGQPPPVYLQGHLRTDVLKNLLGAYAPLSAAALNDAKCAQGLSDNPGALRAHSLTAEGWFIYHSFRMRILRGSPAELGEAWLTAYLRKGLSGSIPDCPRDGKRGVTRHLFYKTNFI